MFAMLPGQGGGFPARQFSTERLGNCLAGREKAAYAGFQRLQVQELWTGDHHRFASAGGLPYFLVPLQGVLPLVRLAVPRELEDG